MNILIQAISLILSLMAAMSCFIGSGIINKKHANHPIEIIALILLSLILIIFELFNFKFNGLFLGGIVFYIFLAITLIYNSFDISALHCVLFYSIHFYVAFIISLTFIVMGSFTPPIQIFNTEIYVNIAIIIADLSVIALTILLKNNIFPFSSDSKMHSKNSSALIIADVLAFFYLLIMNYYFNQIEYNSWTGIIIIAFSIFIMISVYQSVCLNVIYLNNIKLKSELKNQHAQLTRQLAHYRSYEEYTNSIRVFRHNYKKMMGSVNVLLNNGNIEKAQELIRMINDKMGSEIEVHKQYSNNYILDALLQDTANRCKNIDSNFEATIYIPKNYNIKDMILVEIGTNILDNAIEAISQVEDYRKRFFKIESNTKDGWIIMRFTNSYQRIVHVDESGSPITNKIDNGNHGLGLKSCEQILQEIDGFIDYDIDNNNLIFTVTVGLHI